MRWLVYTRDVARIASGTGYRTFMGQEALVETELSNILEYRRQTRSINV